MSGHQGNQTPCDDNFFYLPAPTTGPVPHSVTASIQQLFNNSSTTTTTVVHNAVDDVPELLSGCLPKNASTSIPELGSNYFSEYRGNICDSGETLRKLRATVLDSYFLSKEQQKTGKQLLAQLERDLLEFDLLMGRSSSPPEVDTDSLEETLRSLSLLSSHEQLIRKVHQTHQRPNDDSDSDTVKSETSNFSCDSLEDRETEDQEEVTPVKECKTIPQQPPVSEAGSRTLPHPRRKRQRWQRLSLEGVTKIKPNDYESDVFPTNEGPSNSQVFRTSSDTALANSDSGHSDVQTPTNPPFFSVKSPGPSVSTVRSAAHASCDHTSQAGTGNTNTDGDVSTVTIETHSYRLEHSNPIPFPIPQPPMVEQLKRESRETSPHRQPQKGQTTLPPANVGEAEDFPVVQAQPLPPGPPPAVYLPSSQPSLPQGIIPAPGRAHRVLLAKKVTIQQVLPSKRKARIPCSAWLLPLLLSGMRNVTTRFKDSWPIMFPYFVTVTQVYFLSFQDFLFYGFCFHLLAFIVSLHGLYI